MPATSHQKKVLRFFDLPFSPNISSGAAGWEIGNLMFDENNRDRWSRYILATEDFDGKTDQLSPFSEDQLRDVKIPDGLSAHDAVRKLHREFVEDIVSTGSPFDSPEPKIKFDGKQFIFSGRFNFGSRKKCQEAVVEKGGEAPATKSITEDIDYLVIGDKGSTHWSHGEYGNKIESAILKRRELGNLAIVSEAHWTTALD